MNTILSVNSWLVALTLTAVLAPYPSAISPNAVPDEVSVFVSRDHGITWTPGDSGFPTGDGVNAIAVHNERVYAGTDNHGIWTMDKNGWSVQSTGLPKAARILALLSHHQILYAGLYQGGLYYSTDDGDTWHLLGDERRINVRALNVHNGIVYAGTDTGIYLVDIRTGWQQLLEGIQINVITTNEVYIYAGTHEGAIRSTDGTNWEPIYTRGAIQQIALQQNEIHVMDYSENVYRALQDRPFFIKEDLFLPHKFFRLTPSSPRILRGDWSDLSFVNAGSRRGLPAEAALSVLIQTPFGLLAARRGLTAGC